MANLNASAIAQFTSPVIRSLKWAANASLTRLESTPNSEKAMAAAIAFPTRPLGRVKDGSGAHKAISAFCAMLVERGITPPPAHTIAPSTILGAFGVTDLSVDSLRHVANTCKTALEQRREQVKAGKAEPKPAAAVTNVLGTEAPKASTPKASAPKVSKPAKAEPPKAVTECKCGAKGEWTKDAPFCAKCGCKVWKAKPGRKAKASKPAEQAASVGSVVNG